MNLRKIFTFLLAIPLIFLINACDPWDKDKELKNSNIGESIYTIIQSDADLSTFAQILKLTGYDKYLQKEQSLTVFAPRNEALQGMDLQNTEALNMWIKNYIAQLSFYTNEEGKFSEESIEMINGKSVPLGISTVSGSNIVKANIQSANGVLHVIDGEITFRKNIWEYMQDLSGNAQVDFIKSLEEKVMDMEKSIQKGVDQNGSPIFDTVWTTKNTFLDAYPINNEKGSYTVILLDKSVFDTLQVKYAKYFAQDDSLAQYKEISRQIALDMILKKTEISQSGRYPSVDGVLVDINSNNIVETYQASNGIVYKVNDARVKMYNNKIKEQIIEAEDYELSWDERDAWLVRYRPWASGGKDVVLKGFTINTFDYDYYNTTLNAIRHKTVDKTSIGISYRTNDPVWSRTYNPYLQFKPVMYSTSYQISWVTYDDVGAHTRIALDSTTEVGVMTLEQKLFVSFPGKPVLRRETDGQVKNNFSTVTLMASSVKAGIHREDTLTRYRKVDTSTPATSNLFMLNSPYTFEDVYGKDRELKCPTYGKATLWVSNTVREKGTASSVAGRNPGLIFLDYIKLTPHVNVND